MRNILLILGLLLSFRSWSQTPELVVPVSHQFGLRSAEFSSDDQLIVSAGFDRTIKIWEANTGLLLRTITHIQPVTSAHLSHDKKYIVGSTVGGSFLWDTMTGKLIRKFESGFTISTQISHDDRYLLTLSINEQSTNLWDVATGKLVYDLASEIKTSVEKMFISSARNNFLTISAEFNHNSSMIIAPTSLNSVGVWEARSGKLFFQLQHHNTVQSAKFSSDGLWAIVATASDSLFIWSVRTGKLTRSFRAMEHILPASKSHRYGERIALFNPHDGTILSTSAGETLNYVDIHEPDSGKLGISFMSDTTINSISFNHKGDQMVMALDDNSISINRVSDGKVVQKIASTSKITSAKFSPDKTAIGVAYGSEVMTFDAISGKLTGRFSGARSDISFLAFNPDNSMLAAASLNDSIFVWDLRTHTLSDRYKIGQVRSLSFDNTGNSVLATNIVGRIHSRDVAKKTSSSKLNLRDLYDFFLVFAPGDTLEFSDANFLLGSEPSLKKRVYPYIWSQYSGSILHPITTAASADRSMLAIQFPDDSLRIYNIKTGKTIHSVLGLVESRTTTYWTTYISDKQDFSVSPDNSHFYVGSFASLHFSEFSPDNSSLIFPSIEQQTKLYNLSTRSSRIISGTVQGADWSSGRALILEGNQLVLKDINTGDALLKLTLIGGDDYLITHPSGLFDASPGAMRKLHFVQGMDVIQFDQVKERYYEPGLWKKVVSGESLRKVDGFKSIELPPDVVVSKVDGNGFLPVTLVNRGGGIGEVNVFINGKEVIKDARKATRKTDMPVLSLKIFVGKNRSIVKGRENFIGIKAWNAAHWVVSRSQVVSYQSSEIETYKPNIYILTCGVSNYAGEEIDLKYAAKDADDMSLALQLGATKLFGPDKTHVYNLTTTDPASRLPTKDNIRKVFGEISEVAHPLDILVVYISGHGADFGGQDGDWYFMTQDAHTANASAYADPVIRGQSTLSSSELIELSKSVPALKQVLLIDACASGKVVDNFIVRRDIESSTLRALDRMRDRTGMHIITGCTADAVSYEATKFGQGILTYSLLEGVRGAALREDQYIDVSRLFQYAQDRVPQLAEGIGGIQSPQVFSPQAGQSFDIGLLTDKEKMAIPIAHVRPVYIRSNFIDDDQLEDDLHLGKLIDETLNEVARRGANAPIIFVDVRDYPDGCKLSGRYKKESGIIKLTLRKKCEGNDTVIQSEGRSVDEVVEKVMQSL